MPASLSRAGNNEPPCPETARDPNIHRTTRLVAGKSKGVAVLLGSNRGYRIGADGADGRRKDPQNGHQNAQCGCSHKCGGIAGRNSGQESLHLLLSPKFGISWLACFLGRASASDAEKVIRETGELPPHLVLGFSASVDLAPDRPTTQPKLVEGAELTAYVDLRFSNDLAFRIGVPVKATLVKREATETVPERSDLQWSVPVSIVALIKQ